MRKKEDRRYQEKKKRTETDLDIELLYNLYI